MENSDIEVERAGNDTVYIRIPTNLSTFGKVVRIEDLIPEYKGPMVNFDFNSEGELMGIEVIVFGMNDENEEHD
jgi:Protein of unknown function (DUF2283)